MKYKVKAVAKNRRTGFQVGKIRTEVINTKTNELFKDSKNKEQVRERYEVFWNDLNPKSEEIVDVLNVKKVK